MPSWGTLVTVVLAFVVLPAIADEHWTTNGVHKGVLERSVPTASGSGLDDQTVAGGHDYIGKYRLAYALWSLDEKPVHDFVFTWDWREADLVVTKVDGNVVMISNLMSYQDLARQFLEIRPVAVTIETSAEFRDAANHRFALIKKVIQPDMIDRAGSTNPVHGPGCPGWADFFQASGAKNKQVFEDAASVCLTEPKLIAIEWPQEILDLLGKEFLRRKAVGRATTGLNPLEKGVLESAADVARENPLERSVRDENDRALARAEKLEAEGPRAEVDRLAAEERARIALQAASNEDSARARRLQAEEERLRESEQGFVQQIQRASQDAQDRAFQRAAAAQRRRKQWNETHPLLATSQGWNFTVPENEAPNSAPSFNFGVSSDRFGFPSQSTFKSTSFGGSGEPFTLVGETPKKTRKVYDFPCESCDGTAKCSGCRGKGNLSWTETVTLAHPGATVVTPDDPKGERQFTETCSQCQGSGVCQRCKGTRKSDSYRVEEVP